MEEKKQNFILKHKLISLIILILIIIFGYRVYDYFSAEEVKEAALPVNVKIEKAMLTDISLTAPLTGRIQPIEDVAIVPLAQGKVTSVSAKVGDYVHKGDVLFNIDSSAVAGGYNQAKAQYDAIASTYQRMLTLVQEGAVSRQDFESVEAQYKAAAAGLSQAGQGLSYYTVTSPIDGYVTSLSVSVGSVAGGGMAGSVANVDELKIDATVSEAMAAKVHVGDPVEVYVASVGKTFTGVISTFSPVPSLGTLTYPLSITMDPNEELFAGMFAEIHITSEKIEKTLCVSSESVMIKDGQTIVAVIYSDNIPTLVPVETGIDNGEKVQILSGIKEGDVVICSGQQFVTDGLAVNIVEE